MGTSSDPQEREIKRYHVSEDQAGRDLEESRRLGGSQSGPESMGRMCSGGVLTVQVAEMGLHQM